MLIHLRLKKVLHTIESQGLDGFLVTSQANVSYLTGFKSGESIAFVSPKGCYFLTDFRYVEEAVKEVDPKFHIEMAEQKNLFKAIGELTKRFSVKRLGFEKDGLSFGRYERLRECLKSVRLHPVDGIVEELRMVKDAQELQAIKKAVKIVLNGFHSIRRFIKQGRTERQAAADLEYFFKSHGADKASFDIIVASGPNSSMPHAIPTDRMLRKNDLVLVDAGVRCGGYNSDLTRPIFLGRMTRKIRKIYNIVVKAQTEALERIKPGEKLSEIDKAARAIIEVEGFGKYFGHGLGHGIGLEIHEKPRIAQDEGGVLKEGMVFTIEPGIYIQDLGGIRIEDMILVTKSGYEILTYGLHKSI